MYSKHILPLEKLIRKSRVFTDDKVHNKYHKGISKIPTFSIP